MLENTKKVSSFLKRPWSNYALQNFKNIFFSVPARQRDNKPKCKYRYQTEKEQTKKFEFSRWNGQTIRKDGSFYPFLTWVETSGFVVASLAPHHPSNPRDSTAVGSRFYRRRKCFCSPTWFLGRERERESGLSFGTFELWEQRKLLER